MKAVICPVCTGSGIVESGFYNRTSNMWTSAGGTETCRTCEGKGWVSVPDEVISSIIEPDTPEKYVKRARYVKKKTKELYDSLWESKIITKDKLHDAMNRAQIPIFLNDFLKEWEELKCQS